MSKTTLVTALFLAGLAGAPLLAQAPVERPPVNVTRIIDRPEFRLSRNEIFANSTRAPHAHNETAYFVFMPLSAPLELEVEGEGVLHLEPWEAHLMKGELVHSFTNNNPMPVQFMEIFVQKTSPSASLDLPDILAMMSAPRP